MIKNLFNKRAPHTPIVARAAGGAHTMPTPMQLPLEPVPSTSQLSMDINAETILAGGFRRMAMPPGSSTENGAFGVVTNGDLIVGLRRQDMVQTAAGYFFMTQLRKAHPSAKLLDVTAATMREIEAMDEGITQVARVQTHSNAQQQGYELVTDALKVDASDIHIDIESKGERAPSVLLRMRVHGELDTTQLYTDAQSVKVFEEVNRALFQNEDTGVSSERNTSTLGGATGRFYRKMTLPVRGAEIRFECDVTSTGTKTVMRILNYEGKPSVATDLAGLGFSTSQCTDMLQAFQAPNGLILSMGATGAGKTTTVATALNMEPHPERKSRLGMEQPPEISIPYMSQLAFSEDDFKNALRGALRLDPDVIYGGEINNGETARLCIQAAMTGHLVPATLHANNVNTGLRRLVGEKGMQVPLEDICADGVLRLAQFQTLFPTLCPECKVPALPYLSRPEIEAMETLEIDPMGLFVRSQGARTPCPHCAGRGIRKRTVLAEVVRPTHDYLDALLHHGTNAAMEVYRGMRRTKFSDEDQTGKNAMEHGLYKASIGLICAKQLVNEFDVTMHPEVLKKEAVRRQANDMDAASPESLEPEE